MTYFCTLASGSEGNCYIYVNGRQRILIDAGKNTRYINDCLRQLALSVSDLTHILITHSHADHVSALPVQAHPGCAGLFERNLFRHRAKTALRRAGAVV